MGKYIFKKSFLGGSVVMNFLLSRRRGLDAWVGKVSNSLQYSCRENPMGRAAWWAMVHGVKESQMTEATEYAPVQSGNSS